MNSRRLDLKVAITIAVQPVLITSCINREILIGDIKAFNENIFLKKEHHLLVESFPALLLRNVASETRIAIQRHCA